MHKAQKPRKKFLIPAIAAVAAVALLFFFLNKKGGGTESTIAVSRGTVVEEVSVTGKTQPIEDLKLAFEKSGKVLNVLVKAGDRVKSGARLVELDGSELVAELAKAQAQVQVERAKLAELKRGSRTEDIQIKQTELKKAEQDLANEYDNVLDTINDSFIKADDAVRKQLDQLFSDDETNPKLTFSVKNSQLQIDIESLRGTASQKLAGWKRTLETLKISSSPAGLDQAIIETKSYLETALTLLQKSMDAVTDSIGLSQTTADTYRSNITTGRTNVNTALQNENSEEQAIATQKIVVQKIRDELTLTLAGNTPEAVQAEEASLLAAEAEVKIIQAQLSKMTLRAPISGLITKQDAKVGEIVAANTPLVFLISEGELEIEANVPEVDIGKISIGNTVGVTFDAFLGERFSGKVVWIDPAETIIDGVVNFKIKVALEAKDERLKSGLTSNLDIQTRSKENVLILPQFALLETDKGVFVKLKESDGKIREAPVTVGVRGKDGLLEIVSGVQEGDTVLNIGVKNGR